MELTSCGPSLVAALREPRGRHAQKLIENGEFKFQLDCVDHGFGWGFADIIIRVFQTNQHQVHAHAADIDEDELERDFSRLSVVN